MFCPSCGAEYKQPLKFCKNCGVNLSPTENKVEVTIPRPPLLGMTWATILFSLLGGIISLSLLIWSLVGGFTGYKESRLAMASVACFLFTSAVAFFLLRQIGRLTNLYQDTIKQTVHKEVETQPITQAVLPTPPVSFPLANEPMMSVTENTTRWLSVNPK